MTERLFLPRKLVQQLLHHAQLHPQEEVCGLISSANGQPARSFPIRNIAVNRSNSFAMEPEDQLAVQKKIREQKQSLFAIYHSHPTSPPVPSAADIADCGYPELLYLIISLNTKGVLELRGWRLTDGEVSTVPLKI